MSSSSETPYRLQLGFHRGNNNQNDNKNNQQASSNTDNSISSSSIIDDFHPLHFKDRLNRQASQQSSSAGPGFQYTGPSVDEDGASVSSLGSIGWYMTKSARQRLRNNKLLSNEDKKIVQYLAMRKFHIPGNSYWQDYFYWFSNNHPIMCFWFADPRHPLGKGERILNLTSSLAFGLAATCSVVLWFHYHEDRDFDNLAIRLFGYYDITVGMLALLLFSGPLHVVFDLSIYFLQACPPCRPGGFFETYNFPEYFQNFWLWMGAHLAFLITIASMALAVNVMLIRASVIDDGDDQDITFRFKNYSFVLLYCLEVLVANFIVFPLGTMTVFSGVLGCCGRIPGLGGRTYQVRAHQRKLERRRRKCEV